MKVLLEGLGILLFVLVGLGIVYYLVKKELL
jgi:hypothetical protein